MASCPKTGLEKSRTLAIYLGLESIRSPAKFAGLLLLRGTLRLPRAFCLGLHTGDADGRWRIVSMATTPQSPLRSGRLIHDYWLTA